MLFLFITRAARTNKITEKRMRSSRTALELGMKLGCNKPGMICQFDHFNQCIICRTATNNHAMSLHAFPILIIELIAMAMTFKYNRFSIRFVGFCARGQATYPVTQAHSTTFISYIALRVHKIDDWIWGLRIKFCAISIGHTQNVTCEFNDSNLHTQAQAKIGNVISTSEVGCFDFSFNSTMPKATRHNHPSHIL